MGVYSACQNHGNVETMIKQVNLYQDQSRRLEIAKIIELAAFTNMRKTVAYHLRCTDSKEIREIGQELKSTCLVNNHILSRSWDFVPERGGIYLNESGKTKFIEAFNSGLVRKVTVDDKKLTYAQILRREVRNYRSLILHETPYRPYS